MAPASIHDWFRINTLFVRYATALDACDVDTVVACFEPDGWLDNPVVGRFEGSEGIREFALRTVRLIGRSSFQHQRSRESNSDAMKNTGKKTTEKRHAEDSGTRGIE